MTTPKDKQAAEDHGNEKAMPVIRSMYDHISRGEAAKRFAESFLAGIEHERKRAERLVGWMYANVPEMECRGDEDCDHCLAVQFILKYEEGGE